MKTNKPPSIKKKSILNEHGFQQCHNKYINILLQEENTNYAGLFYQNDIKIVLFCYLTWTNMLVSIKQCQGKVFHCHWHQIQQWHQKKTFPLAIENLTIMATENLILLV